MEESIFVDEKLQCFEGDEDEHIAPVSTSSPIAPVSTSSRCYLFLSRSTVVRD
jgi:hypothetical protein